MRTFWVAAAAAVATYFFDPDSGRRRRALLRDKFAWLRDEAGDVREAAEGRAEDLRNRTTGVLHETRSAVRDITGGAGSAAATMGTTDDNDQQARQDPQRQAAGRAA